MLLARYGIREWGTAALGALVLSMVAGPLLQWWWSLLLIWLAWLAVALFFRDPWRRVPNDLNQSIMLSPADGKVSAVEHYESHESTEGGPAVCVRIFLSLLDVHVNRSPCDAKVVSRIYRPGQFLDARTAESARVNESNLIIMERESGAWAPERFGLRQVSGKVARRIVDATTDGARYRRGERIGMIKFGSTTELILPRPGEVRVLVQVGDRVKGGLTPLAEIADPRPDENQRADRTSSSSSTDAAALSPGLASPSPSPSPSSTSSSPSASAVG